MIIFNMLCNLLRICGIRENIVDSLSDCNKFMLGMVSKDFVGVCRVRHRGTVLDVCAAIKEKSLSYLKFIDDVRRYELNINSISEKLFGTNDAEFIISVLTEYNSLYIIPKMFSRIKRLCSVEEIAKLVRVVDEETVHRHIMKFSMDAIIEFSNMGYDVYNEKYMKDVDKFYEFDCKKDIRFLKILKKLGVGERMIIKYFCHESFAKNVEYATWILDNVDVRQRGSYGYVGDLDYDRGTDIDYFIKTIFKCKFCSITNMVTADVVKLLYLRGTTLNLDMYEKLYLEDMVHVLGDEDRNKFNNQFTVDMVMYDAHRGIFNTRNEMFYCDRGFLQHKLFYYIVVGNRFDLYSYEKFNKVRDVGDIAMVCRFLLVDQFLSFVKHFYKGKKNKDCFWKREYRLDFAGNERVVEIYLKKVSVGVSDLVKFHMDGQIVIWDYCLKNPRFIKWNNDVMIKSSVVKYICKVTDDRMLKYIVGICKGVDIEGKDGAWALSILKVVFSMCRLDVLLKLELFEGRCGYMNFENFALMCGNNEIVDYVLDKIVVGGKGLDCYSLCCAYLNSSKLAKRVLMQVYGGSVNYNMTRCIFGYIIDVEEGNRYYRWLEKRNVIIGDCLIDKNYEEDIGEIMHIIRINKNNVVNDVVLKCIIKNDFVEVLKKYCKDMNVFTDDILNYAVVNSSMKVLEFLSAEGVVFPSVVAL